MARRAVKNAPWATAKRILAIAARRTEMATETGRKMVYRLTEGGADMVDLLGSKGAHASEMARIGIPVPPGFVITTEVSLEYYREGRKFPGGLWDAIVANRRKPRAVAVQTAGKPSGTSSFRKSGPVSCPRAHSS